MHAVTHVCASLAPPRPWQKAQHKHAPQPQPSPLPLPCRLELQNLYAQVLTGVGRDPVLNAEANSHPASSSVARIATSLNVINQGSYPEDLPVSDVAWMTMCQAAPCLGELRPRKVVGRGRAGRDGVPAPNCSPSAPCRCTG